MFFNMSNILVAPNFFPTWITQLVFEQQTIRNESIDIYFPNIPIELQNYDLICVGIRDDIKYIVSLKILACANTPLKERTQIAIMIKPPSRTQPMQPQTQTATKRKSILSPLPTNPGNHQKGAAANN